MTSNNRPERSHILVAAKPTVTTDGFGSEVPIGDGEKLGDASRRDTRFS